MDTDYTPHAIQGLAPFADLAAVASCKLLTAPCLFPFDDMTRAQPYVCMISLSWFQAFADRL